MDVQTTVARTSWHLSASLPASSELETHPGAGSSSEPGDAVNAQMPGIEDPDISEGAAAEGPRDTDLSVTPPTQNLSSR